MYVYVSERRSSWKCEGYERGHTTHVDLPRIDREMDNSVHTYV